MPRDGPSPADFAYAKSAGVMFDLEALTHETAVNRIAAAQSLGDARSFADALMASLSSRQVHLRPALASYFAVQELRPHQFVGQPSCASCGQLAQWEHDFNATNFARLKWGAVPRFFMVDHAFILERFAVEPCPVPSEGDRVLLHQLLAVADSLEDEARARDLERAWQPLLRSSREEREVLVEILVACGVLAPSRTTPADFKRIPWKSNWTDYAALWRGDDGVDRSRTSALFAWG